MTVIYDFRFNTIDYKTFILATLSFGIFGLIIFLSRKFRNKKHLNEAIYKEEVNISLSFDSKIEYFHKHRSMMLVLFIILVIINFTFDPYINRNYVKYFKESKVISGKVNSLSKSKMFDMISFAVNDKNFSILENGFSTNCQLYNCDSIKITFIETINNIDTNRTVVEIER